MRGIIACENSGRVRHAFEARGHLVLSVDLLPAEDGASNHVVGDAIELIERYKNILDFVIAHPPCTRLANSGVRWLRERNLWKDMDEASAFFMYFYNLPVSRICVENPIPHKYAGLPRYSQIIQPWQFGHGETKATCLWLKGLPLLKPTNIVEGREQRVWKMSPSPERARERSRTYQGIADAMASQWG